ncbi:MAG: hypothetical protein OEZ34_05150, partial [Spirochaetia bacterium]|nr:hypothetical protein [Spirochaetia bacterium]
MAHYEKVEMTDDVIEMFRTQQRIPLHFYNQDGTILIYSKENATPEEIDRLIRYSEKGIYFDTEDEHLLKKTAKRSIPDGLTDTKLISTRFADTLYSETQYIFDELKRTTISSLHTKRTTSALNNIFSEFQNQDDVMTGLVNIIEKLQDKKGSVQLSITTKRTVV